MAIIKILNEIFFIIFEFLSLKMNWFSLLQNNTMPTFINVQGKSLVSTAINNFSSER